MKLGPKPRLPGEERQKGFSLVEMMIAVSIILIGVMTVFSTELSSLRVVGSSRETNTGMTELQAAMETVLTFPHGDIPNHFPVGVPIGVFNSRSLNNEKIIPTYPNYQPGGAIPDPLEIVLTLQFDDRTGGARTLRLTSRKTR